MQPIIRLTLRFSGNPVSSARGHAYIGIHLSPGATSALL